MSIKDRIKSLESYLADDSKNLRLIVDLADLYLRSGSFDQARNLVEKGLDLDAGNGALKFQYATIEMASGNVVSAHKLLETLYGSGNTSIGVRYNLALCQAHLGDFESVEAMLQRHYSPDDEIYLPERLLLLRALHNNSKLYEALELGVQLYDQTSEPNGELLSILSLLYLDSGDREKAEEFALLARESGSHNTEHLCTQATLALEDFDTETSTAIFDQIIARQPSDGRSWLGLGLISMLEKDLPRAETHLTKATVYMPRHLGTLNTLTWVQLMLGKIPEAQKTATKALDLDPAFSESQGTMAVVNIALGETKEAELLAKKAIRLDKNSFSGRFAQTLLMDPQTSQDKIQSRLQTIFSSPMLQDQTLEQNLKRYITKFGR